MDPRPSLESHGDLDRLISNGPNRGGSIQVRGQFCGAFCQQWNSLGLAAHQDSVLASWSLLWERASWRQVRELEPELWASVGHYPRHHHQYVLVRQFRMWGH